SDRAAFANKVGADVFISLHMNSWTKSSVNGTEVYYSTNNNKASFSGITSKKMASLFCKRLVSAMGTNNRGISAQKYTVVHKNTVPAVLLELGFISGSSDFPKLSNAVYQEKATATIYNTIVELFNTYPTGR
ncbi:MAG: N-acetylmuramoyl-L-alanine amidase, partial [Lachnospiraceae bacterium]|nr:N-acetylmuramoyl-L-alanine amidase [Lachnospiraceae bacterium]